LTKRTELPKEKGERLVSFIYERSTLEHPQRNRGLPVTRKTPEVRGDDSEPLEGEELDPYRLERKGNKGENFPEEKVREKK